MPKHPRMLPASLEPLAPEQQMELKRSACACSFVRLASNFKQRKVLAWGVMHPTRNSYASRIVGAAGHLVRRSTEIPLAVDDPAKLSLKLMSHIIKVIRLDTCTLRLKREVAILRPTRRSYKDIFTNFTFIIPPFVFRKGRVCNRILIYDTHT